MTMNCSEIYNRRRLYEKIMKETIFKRGQLKTKLPISINTIILKFNRTKTSENQKRSKTAVKAACSLHCVNSLFCITSMNGNTPLPNVNIRISFNATTKLN